MNTDRIRSALSEMTADQRALAYVELNCFKWPKSLWQFKPHDWDCLDNHNRHYHVEGKTLWKIIHEMTSEYERSRAWWLESLGRTNREHIAWWIGRHPIA